MGKFVRVGLVLFAGACILSTCVGMLGAPHGERASDTAGISVTFAATPVPTGGSAAVRAAVSTAAPTAAPTATPAMSSDEVGFRLALATLLRDETWMQDVVSTLEDLRAIAVRMRELEAPASMPYSAAINFRLDNAAKALDEMVGHYALGVTNLDSMHFELASLKMEVVTDILGELDRLLGE